MLTQKLSLSLLASCLFAGSAWADSGHDHGPATNAGGAPALPRFAASSAHFELVGVLNGQQLSLYLDRTADNAPVQGASLALNIGGQKLNAQPGAEGEFQAQLPQPLPPGELNVSATVSLGDVSEPLSTELHLPSTAAEAAHAPEGKAGWALLAAGTLALLASGFFLLRRRQSAARLGAQA